MLQIVYSIHSDHFYMDFIKHVDMMVDLKNDALKIQILLTLLALYRYVSLRQIDVANLVLLGIVLLLLV